MAFRLKITKDRIKFSVAHFTIFSETQAERLHGHNYYVSLEVRVSDVDPLGFAASMDDLKTASYKISQELDEYVLVPTQNPHLKISEIKDQVEVLWNSKQYLFPKEDVRLLDISNVTCENLAQWFWQRLVKELSPTIEHLEITVRETHGQEAIYGKEVRV